jgi:hypothetical protein
VRPTSEAVSEVSQPLVRPRHGTEEDEERVATASAEVNLLPSMLFSAEAFTLSALEAAR